MNYPFRRSTLRALTLAATIGLAPASWGQNPPSAQQYEDVLRQLQQSQDRKNQLADENAKLSDEIGRLKTQLVELEQQLRSVEASERTYFLRAHYAAWQTFMDRYPLLLRQFQRYLNSGNVGLNAPNAAAATSTASVTFFDADWPFSAGRDDAARQNAGYPAGIDAP